MSVKSEEEVLQELMTGVTFPLKYLGSVTVIESLKKLTSSIERETLTRYCMYLVCKRLKLCSINSNCDTKLASKVGPVLIVDKVVELNIALNAFVILDEDGVRIIERHPIDYISFASPARNGIFCFVSNTCVKNGRRCLVFKEPDNSVKYIIDTMSKVFSVKRRDFDQNQLMKSLPLNISGFIDERYHEFAHLFQLAVSEGIETKIWFHGLVDRGHAEALLHREGDFLVRLSRNTVNNFVLSGYTKSTTKHFLLIDETDNKVRKHSQVFETIVQLVEYHRAWYVPLISEGSELLLIRPIARGTPRNIVLTLTFDEPFHGLIYSENGYPNCIYVNASVLSQRYYAIKVPLDGCDTIKNSDGDFENTIIIQEESSYAQIIDKKYLLTCIVPDGMVSTMLTSLNFGGITVESEFTTSRVMIGRMQNPTLRYHVQLLRTRNGREIDSSSPITVGDEISYIIRVPLVKSDARIGRCWAKDNVSTLELSDTDGCSLQLKGNVWNQFERQEENDEIIFKNDIKAWAFPTSNEVNILCNLHMCRNQCNTIACATRHRRNPPLRPDETTEAVL